MPCPRTQHLNNVPRLRGEKHDISLKILHQAGFETARQAATSAERHALTIAPCPSLSVDIYGVFDLTVFKAWKVKSMSSKIIRLATESQCKRLRAGEMWVHSNARTVHPL